MKKLFVLTTILALGAISTFAQGNINANNSGTGVLIQVQNPGINGGQPVTAGNPATAAGFGTDVGKGQVTVALYAAANGTATSALEASSPIWTGNMSGSGVASAQGTIAPGTAFVLPTKTGFDGSAPVEFVLYGASLDGAYTGWSNVGSVQPQANGGTSSSPSIYGGSGITSFILVPVPEPATIALGGLGAAALLLFRRRK
jgi:hypothetical protein